MTTHRNTTPISTTRPIRDSTTDSTAASVHAEQPPTPLAVWPCGPLQDCPEAATTGRGPHPGWPPCTGQLPDRLLYRAVGEFSHPGDLVLIGDDPRGVLSAAALDFDRQALTRAATAATRRQLGITAARHPHLPPDRLQISTEPATWRLPVNHPGADLLLIPSPCPTALATPTGQTHGRTHSEGHGQPATRAQDSASDPVVRWQQQLLAASLPLLRPGALVLVITGGSQRDGRLVDRLGQLTSYATAGLRLGYLQHLIGICADLHGGQLHPSRRRPGFGPKSAEGRQGAPVHEVIHTDLLLFSTPEDPGPAGRHDGGQLTGLAQAGAQLVSTRHTNSQHTNPQHNGDDHD